MSLTITERPPTAESVGFPAGRTFGPFASPTSQTTAMSTMTGAAARFQCNDTGFVMYPEFAACVWESALWGANQNVHGNKPCEVFDKFVYKCGDTDCDRTWYGYGNIDVIFLGSYPNRQSLLRMVSTAKKIQNGQCGSGPYGGNYWMPSAVLVKDFNSDGFLEIHVRNFFN
jgi:hypothetical protein